MAGTRGGCPKISTFREATSTVNIDDAKGVGVLSFWSREDSSAESSRSPELPFWSGRRGTGRARSMGSMKSTGRTTEVGWFPRKDSYEEAVLNWYEQIETSFRRRRQENRRTETERETHRQSVVETRQAVFD